MDSDQFSVLVDKIATLQKSIDILSNDREYDVKKVEEIKEEMGENRMRLGAVEGQIDELRKQLKDVADKIQNRVGEVIQPMMEQTKELKDSIDNKEFVEVRDIKKPWWKKLIRR